MALAAEMCCFTTLFLFVPRLPATAKPAAMGGIQSHIQNSEHRLHVFPRNLPSAGFDALSKHRN